MENAVPFRMLVPTVAMGLCLTAGSSTTAQDDNTEGEYLILGTVIDQGSGEPIGDFQVLPGTPFRLVKAKDDPSPAVWQPHLTRAYHDGRFQWPKNRGYRQMRLRIEAEGYQPHQTAWISKDDEPSTQTFRLKRDAGISGRVFTPRGAPAAGAVLAVALPNRTIQLQNRKVAGSDQPPPTKLSERWRRPLVVTADSQGNYRLPTEPTPAAMVCVVHDSGYLDLPFPDLSDAQQLKLQAWGRVVGHVTCLDLPAAGEHVELYISRDAQDYPMIEAWRLTAQTDAKGRFVFEHVPPGPVQLSRRVRLPETGELSSYAFPIVHLKVAGGDTDVRIGGLGRTVQGRLQGLDSYRGVTLRIAPNAPHMGFGGDNPLWQGFAALQASALGPLVFRDQLPVRADGHFQIPDVIPEWYQLFVIGADGRRIGGSQFRVQGYEQPGSERPQDIGSVQLRR